MNRSSHHLKKPALPGFDPSTLGSMPMNLDMERQRSLSDGERETRAMGVEDEGEEEEKKEVKEMAMVTLGLLKQEVKVMLHQVKHLVKASPDLAAKVFTTDMDGWTPVHACALRGKKKVLKAMLQAGIDVNLGMGQPEGLPGRCSLLHLAAHRPDRKVADYLLHHGAHVNAQDSFGRTPLFYAHRQGNREMVRLLMDNGAYVGPEVEVTSEKGEAPEPMKTSDDLNTPEPKLSRFCFLSLSHHHHRQQQQQRRRRRRRHERSPHGADRPHSGHRTS